MRYTCLKFGYVTKGSFDKIQREVSIRYKGILLFPSVELVFLF
jgi:hypothetical protein